MESKLKSRKESLMANKRKNCDKISNRHWILKNRAKRKGLPLEITMEEHDKILGDRTCFYCDTNFSKDRGSGLNRCDSTKGYVLGNLKPCCKVCNGLMSNFTVEQLRSRLIKIYKRITKGEPKK